MDLQAAQDYISLRIRQTPGLPNVVLADDQESRPLPRWVLQNSAQSRGASSMEGSVVTVAEVMVRVETRPGEFEKENKRLVRLLVQRFKPGDTFNGVTIEEIPDVRPPLSEEGVYATPVFIRGRFFQTP